MSGQLYNAKQFSLITSSLNIINWDIVFLQKVFLRKSFDFNLGRRCTGSYPMLFFAINQLISSLLFNSRGAECSHNLTKKFLVISRTFQNDTIPGQ